MAHYALLNESSIVTEVIVGVDESELIDGLTPETWYGQLFNQTCIRTSYNGKIRYNFAGTGFTYDAIDDAFIPPMPECGHESLALLESKQWQCNECEDLYEAYFV